MRKGVSANEVTVCLHVLQLEFMGVICRDAVNDCDIPENCTGNSSQVRVLLSHLLQPHNLSYRCSASRYVRLLV